MTWELGGLRILQNILWGRTRKLKLCRQVLCGETVYMLCKHSSSSMKVGLTGILCSGIPHDFALELQKKKKKKNKKTQTLENPQMVLYGYAGRLIGGSFSSKRVSFNRFKIYARMYISHT
jgi:hypothetical protein